MEKEVVIDLLQCGHVRLLTTAIVERALPAREAAR
jgi:hypothetical protein